MSLSNTRLSSSFHSVSDLLHHVTSLASRTNLRSSSRKVTAPHSTHSPFTVNETVPSFPSGRISHSVERRGRIAKIKKVAKAAGLKPDSSVLEDLDLETKGSHATADSSKCVLVVGATGGVGQLVTAALVDRGLPIRALLRDVEKAHALFGDQNTEKLQICVGDLRSPEQLDASVFKGVTHVICCTGTTAFPSKRWDGDNTPEKTDWHGVRNLIGALPPTIQRFVLVSSIGVTKYDQLPWSIMNLFGVLKFKKMAEDFLQSSGIPYTIIRAGRLTDGPYTSYDLNTLLKATSGTRRAVLVGQGDKLVGEASRIIVAEACIQALDLACTCGQIYEINSVEGDGPGQDQKTWEELFRSVQTK